ncbi:MAG TPA: VOC family protein [Alphaproteobacteria bacterium]|nr:VOC family protein [Alphaproteobacteria bacterium]
MSNATGRFVWYELMTSDPKAAEAFYRGVVGWSARDAGMPGMSYTLLSADGADIGGLMALPSEARAAGAEPGWIGYVAVDDADARAEQAAQQGGSVQRAPADIPGVGRFAVIADPQGAVLALFKGAGEMRAPVPAGTPGHGGWHELLAADQAAVFDFYAGLFGWSKAESFDMGEMGIYQLFALDGESIGGMMSKPEAVPAPFWLYYFNVGGIDAAEARVEAGGGRIVNGPMEVPGGQWIVQCRDPQGAMFALLAPRR